jgi:hypothetical protein
MGAEVEMGVKVEMEGEVGMEAKVKLERIRGQDRWVLPALFLGCGNR